MCLKEAQWFSTGTYGETTKQRLLYWPVWNSYIHFLLCLTSLHHDREVWFLSFSLPPRCKMLCWTICIATTWKKTKYIVYSIWRHIRDHIQCRFVLKSCFIAWFESGKGIITSCMDSLIVTRWQRQGSTLASESCLISLCLKWLCFA